MEYRRAAGEDGWQRVRMAQRPNDQWRAAFPLPRLGRHEFRVEAWLDRFGGFTVQPGAVQGRVQVAADEVVAARITQVDGDAGDRGQMPEVRAAGHFFAGDGRDHEVELMKRHS